MVATLIIIVLVIFIVLVWVAVALRHRLHGSLTAAGRGVRSILRPIIRNVRRSAGVGRGISPPSGDVFVFEDSGGLGPSAAIRRTPSGVISRPDSKSVVVPQARGATVVVRPASPSVTPPVLQTHPGMADARPAPSPPTQPPAAAAGIGEATADNALAPPSFVPAEPCGMSRMDRLVGTGFITGAGGWVPCACESPEGKWSKACAFPGGVGFVVHARDTTGAEVALKIYAPSDVQSLFGADGLAPVFRRLKQLKSPARDCFVGVEFHAAGLRVRERDTGREHVFDVAVMPWLNGPGFLGLHTFVEKFIADPEQLVRCAAAVRQVWRDLTEADIGHGDLCAKNIVVERKSDGSLRIILIDTDTVSLPGNPSPVTERTSGQAGFQTSGRMKDPRAYAKACPVPSMVDGPSQLVIYLSLLAYASGLPCLAGSGGGQLAFREDDFDSLDQAESLINCLMKEMEERFPTMYLDYMRSLVEYLRRHAASTTGIDAGLAMPFCAGPQHSAYAALEKSICDSALALKVRKTA